VVAPRSAVASSRSVVGDFDGDGQHDRATLDRRGHATEIRIWLSTTQATTVIYSAARIGAIAARDLDGDHRDELIARTHARLHVWTVRSQRFHRVEQPKRAPDGLGAARPNRVEDPPDDVPAGDASTDASSTALLLSPRPRAPDLSPERLPLQTRAGFKSAQLLAPVAPRPPPAL